MVGKESVGLLGKIIDLFGEVVVMNLPVLMLLLSLVIFRSNEGFVFDEFLKSPDISFMSLVMSIECFRYYHRIVDATCWPSRRASFYPFMASFVALSSVLLIFDYGYSIGKIGFDYGLFLLVKKLCFLYSLFIYSVSKWATEINGCNE